MKLPAQMAAVGLMLLSAYQALPAVRRLAGPTAVQMPGFRLADCVEVSPRLRVCKVQRTPEDPMEVVLLEDGHQVGRWASGMPVFGGMFDVRLADLDADGRAELLITDHLSTSNGMAVTFHQTAIVRHFDSDDRTSIAFEHQEFCAECDSGTFMRHPAQRGVSILVTEWMWNVSSIDPQRPPGNYVVGRWFGYAAGRLVPGREVAARRYLLSFNGERHAAKEEPASWFASPLAKRLQRDPTLGNGRVLRTRQAVIVDAGSTEHGGRYDVRLDDGRMLALGVAFVPDGPEFAGRESLDGVGLVKHDVVLPRGIAPHLVIGDVRGRSARIVEYVDGGRERRILWIEGGSALEVHAAGPGRRR